MPADNKKINPYLHFMAGGIGGTCGAVLTCPLEVVKTRLQTQSYHQNNKGLVGMLRDIYSADGIRGLWRGIGPNLMGVIPARAIFFSSYASSKHYLTHELRLNKGKESSLIHLLSAACAGLCTATFTNPIWLIKTRMQLQNSQQRPSQPSQTLKFATTGALKQAQAMSTVNVPGQVHYKNSIDCLVQVVKHEGIKGLFRGLTASYLGIVEGTMQWVLYERLKRSMNHYRGTQEGDMQKASQMWDNLVVAGVAKLVASITTYPHEVLRTRMRQVKSVNTMVDGSMITSGASRYNGMGHVIRSVWKHEGVLAFYGGMGAHLLRTVPNAAIMFFCYESVVWMLQK